MSSVRPKLKPDALKLVTAWDTFSGRTVWRTADHGWTEVISEAVVLTGETANETLAQAKSEETRVAEPYLMEVDENGRPVGRETLRETIRMNGPTIEYIFSREEAHN